MSKDILSSTIVTLNKITDNMNCCKQPNLDESTTETTNQSSENKDQSEADTESHDKQSSNYSRSYCMNIDHVVLTSLILYCDSAYCDMSFVLMQ